jgi:hypothetical protein
MASAPAHAKSVTMMPSIIVKRVHPFGSDAVTMTATSARSVR